MKRTTFKNIIIFSSLIAFITSFMSIGFAAVDKDLSISGNVTYIPNTMLVNNTDDSLFLDCSNISSTAVKKILFQTAVPSSYTQVCDVSEKQNGSVKAYLKSNGSVIVVPTDSSNKIYFNTTTRFRGLKNCSEISFGNIINTKNLRTMKYMFNMLCYNSTCSMSNLDLTGFDTSHVVNMDGAFYNAKNVNSIDVSSFNTSNVKYMQLMFSECDSITELDISNFDTSNACDMVQMFAYSDSLQTIYASNNWNLTNIGNSDCPDAYSGSEASSSGHGSSDGLFLETVVKTAHKLDCPALQSTAGQFARIDSASTPGCLTDVNLKSN